MTALSFRVYGSDFGRPDYRSFVRHGVASHALKRPISQEAISGMAKTGRPANGEVRSEPRVCHVCGNQFRSKFSRKYGKYCSLKCQRKERHPQVGEARACRRCDQTIILTTAMIKRRAYLCNSCNRQDKYRNAAYQRDYRRRNREKFLARGAAYRAANRELCRRSRADWERRHPEHAIARQERRKLKRYGLTVEDYERLYMAQGGVCAICGTVPTKGKVSVRRGLTEYERNKRRLTVDHCHRTRAVRALLCVNCNAILGHAKDRIELLRAAVAYLERYSAEAA
jgi:hypothetical protein